MPFSGVQSCNPLNRANKIGVNWASRAPIWGGCTRVPARGLNSFPPTLDGPSTVPTALSVFECKIRRQKSVRHVWIVGVDPKARVSVRIQRAPRVPGRPWRGMERARGGVRDDVPRAFGRQSRAFGPAERRPAGGGRRMALGPFADGKGTVRQRAAARRGFAGGLPPTGAARPCTRSTDGGWRSADGYSVGGG